MEPQSWILREAVWKIWFCCRNGDLVLSPTASHHAVNYRESVHNRLRAYDNIPTKAGNIQPPAMVQFNKMHNKTSGGGITNPSSASNGLPPVTICQVTKTDVSNWFSKKLNLKLAFYHYRILNLLERPLRYNNLINRHFTLILPFYKVWRSKIGHQV